MFFHRITTVEPETLARFLFRFDKLGGRRCINGSEAEGATMLVEPDEIDFGLCRFEFELVIFVTFAPRTSGHGGARSQVLVRNQADGAKTRQVYGLGLHLAQDDDD